MLLRVTRHLGVVFLLVLSLAGTARAGVRAMRTLQVDADRLPAAGPLEIPPGERLVRAEVVSLECAEDGARAPAGIAVRVGYQGFERGQRLAWLELPEGTGLPAEHSRHRLQLRVLLDLEPSSSTPVPRERVVADWKSPGPSRAARSPAPASAIEGLPPRGGRAAEPFRPTQG